MTGGTAGVRRRTASWEATSAVLLIAWGALAFGAPYAWAYIPLAVGCGLVGLTAGFSPGRRTPRNIWVPAGSLGLVAAAIVVQLVPLPRADIVALSPAADALLLRFDLHYATAVRDGVPGLRHPLSIAPGSTRLALFLLAAFGVLLLGLARRLTGDGCRRIARGVIAVGALLALIAIVQRVVSPKLIYGFWRPLEGGNPYGPFVNRNHFAGWMLMALPLALAHLSVETSRVTRDVRPGWRDRLLWLGSPEASHLTLMGLGIGLMALSVVLSLSRSGILALAAALLIAGVIAPRRRVWSNRRAAVIVYVVFLGVVAISWTGTERVLQRFTAPDVVSLDGRLGTWHDAIDVVKAFPLAGTGIDGYHVAALFYQTHDLNRFFSEAHNDYLQLAAEGGLLVGLPIVLAIGVFIVAVWKRFEERGDTFTEEWLRLGAVVGLMAIALQEFGDFSLQMPGNAVLFAVLWAIALHPGEHRIS